MGIAIGFAAKDTLSNIIAGILLIIDRPFETGDRIEVWSAPSGSATWGDVVNIGLRATKIRTTDNIVIIIPNNEIMKRDIVNYTIITSKIRVRINIGVGYDADIKKAKEIIRRVVDSADWIAKDPPSKVVVKNFGDSAVNLQLREPLAETSICIRNNCCICLLCSYLELFRQLFLNSTKFYRFQRILIP